MIKVVPMSTSLSTSIFSPITRTWDLTIYNPNLCRQHCHKNAGKDQKYDLYFFAGLYHALITKIKLYIPVNLFNYNRQSFRFIIFISGAPFGELCFTAFVTKFNKIL